MNKKDLDLLKFKIKLVFDQIFEDFENPQRKQETIQKLNKVNENGKTDVELLYEYLDILGIQYNWMLNEQKVKADYFDWSERK